MSKSILNKTNKNMLYIRTDGNAEIGTGHVMRCLSIASNVRKSGTDCIFITADEEMKPLINEQGFSVICLDSIWNDIDLETKIMEQLINEQGIKKLLIDSYFVTPDYLSKLNKITYVIYIDDLNSFIYPCSMLINYNIYANNFNYPVWYPQSKLILGPKYAPLRSEFHNLPLRRIHKCAESILITTGGTDENNITGQILKEISHNSQLMQLKYHIVAGKLNKNVSTLNGFADKYKNIIIHHDIKQMSELMQRCDIAISAGGSTLYELCACSVPTVVFSMADNQQMAVSEFSKGYMMGCGDFREGNDVCIKKISDSLLKLTDTLILRSKLSKKCWSLVNPPNPWLI